MAIVLQLAGQHRFLIKKHVAFDMPSGHLSCLHDRTHVAQLEPDAIHVLLQFVNKPRTVLRSQDMLDAVCQRDGVDTRNSLDQIMHSLCEAFYTIDAASCYIWKVPRIGYALTAEVRLWP